MGDHIFENALDTSCNTCGYIRTLTHTHSPGPWKWDENRHWQRCTSCTDTVNLNAGDHQFLDAYDTDCNVCGYTRTAPAEKPNTGDTTHTLLWAGMFLGGVALLYWQLTECKRTRC